MDGAGTPSVRVVTTTAVPAAAVTPAPVVPRVRGRAVRTTLSMVHLAAFLAVCVAAHIVVRIRLPYADPYLLPLVAVLACFGLVVIYRLDEQLAGFALGERIELDTTVLMSVDELRAEVLMGPSAHHVDPEALDARLAAVEGTTAVTVAVTVSRFVRAE